jgi:formyl-CoA transferase
MQDGPTRAKHRDVVDAVLSAWTATRTKREVMETIAGAGVPCGAVLTTLELLNDPDLHARGMMQTIDHPVRGKVTVPAWPVRMSDSHVPLQCAPVHGADSEAIYGAWLGCSPADVKDMRERKVI